MLDIDCTTLFQVGMLFVSLHLSFEDQKKIINRFLILFYKLRESSTLFW